MSWAKLDDRFWSNPKVQRAWRASRGSIGLHAMAITWCAQHQTDGVIDEGFLDMVLASLPARERNAAVRALVDSGLWEDHDGSYVIHDYLEFNPSSAEIERTREWDRRRKELFRDPELIEAIRDRDRDRCRYCGKKVSWKDRRGDSGGTYDHVTPRGPNTLENVVVACRGCNLRKGARTPSEAAMPLLDPELVPEPTQSQVRASSRSGRDLHTRPDPSRPHPNIPPLPPRGNRGRDMAEYEEKLKAFTDEHFPDAPPTLVSHYAQQVRLRGAEPTVEALRPLIERHTTPGEVPA